MRRYVHITIKMSLASFIAILIAQLFSLEYAITAGILAVLSIKMTRLDSIKLAVIRFIDAILALVLGTVIFFLFGYTVIMFAVFTVLFIALSFAFKLQDGIVPSMVLASHLLIYGAFSTGVLLNSTFLITIAILVALALNLLYPMRSGRLLEQFSKTIDVLVIQDLHSIEEALNNLALQKDAYETHQSLKQTMQKALLEAELADKDILFDKERMTMAYLRMRHSQMQRLDRLHELLSSLKQHHPYATTLAHYVGQLKQDIGQKDMATKQLALLKQLLETYRTKPLPAAREEFETRAVLYQMMFELEGFLQAKIKYHQRFNPM